MSNIFVVLIALGVIQGVAEFLPISSSGHLVIFEQLNFFKKTIDKAGLELELFINVSLHVATLFAVLIYLRDDIVKIAKGAFSGIVEMNFHRGEFRSAVNIIAASIPAGVIGILFHEFFRKLFSSTTLVFFMLILNGLILLSTKIISVKDRKLEEIGILESLFIGCFQAVAIIPGISRSGATITGGILAGLVPEESAKFSFLMAIPVIAGAGFLESFKLFQMGLMAEIIIPLTVAVIVTVIVGLISLKILFSLVRRVRIDIFGYYTILLGIIGMIFL